MLETKTVTSASRVFPRQGLPQSGMIVYNALVEQSAAKGGALPSSWGQADPPALHVRRRERGVPNALVKQSAANGGTSLHMDCRTAA
jgi:hypothetical protein